MKNILLFIIPLLLIASCRKDSDFIDIIEPPDTDKPVELVQTTIAGTVLDQFGKPFPDVEIQLNEYTARTRFDGRFTFSDINIYNSKQTLKIEKSGYFNGSRSFTAVAGEQTELLVQMLERLSVGDFSASSSKTINTNEGVQISFPENAIKDADGEVYTGTVNVFANWMDPTAEETFAEMPGDLTGLTTEGEEMGLITYGMLNVELESDSGEALNVAEGKKVELSFPVPDEIIGDAPSTIPLWYFDEIQNTWIEEGSATLINNAYVGEVSHFTPWNCDDPIEVINVTGVVHLTNLRSSTVKIEITSQVTNFEFFACANANGSYSIPAAQGETLLLEIIDQCGEVIYSEFIGPFEEDVVLEPITSESTVDSYFTVSGVLKDCDGNPISNNTVSVVNTNSEIIVAGGSTQADGSFVFSVLACEDDLYQVTATNLADKTQGLSNHFEFNGDNASIDDILTCDPLEDIFIDVNFDNQPFLQNSILYATHASQTIPVGQTGTDSLKFVITLTVLDWMSAQVHDFTFIYSNYQPLNIQVIDFEAFGFEANAIPEMDVTLDGETITSLCIAFNSSDITITDPAIFPGLEEVDLIYFSGN